MMVVGSFVRGGGSSGLEVSVINSIQRRLLGRSGVG